jgi:hypothetical protein
MPGTPHKKIRNAIGIWLLFLAAQVCGMATGSPASRNDFGDTLHYTVPDATISSWGKVLEVTTGRVVAADQNRRAAMVGNTLGSGKTLLCAYPLGYYVASVPSVFYKPEDTHRFYAAFREWAGAKPAFLASNPLVGVVALTGEHRGYLVAVNHSAEAQDVDISPSFVPCSLSRITASGGEPLQMGQSGWRMKLEPYDAIIVE